MHTISHTIMKLSGLLLVVSLSFGVGGCRKEGFTRLMDVEMKYQVIPDAERIRLGDTVKLIAWLPYQQYDRRTNSTVDIRGMEIMSWGSWGYTGLDSVLTNNNINIGIYKFETFFDVQHPFGTFKSYPQNHEIGSMAKTDTAFYFELRLVARRPGVFKLRGEGGTWLFGQGEVSG